MEKEVRIGVFGFDQTITLTLEESLLCFFDVVGRLVTDPPPFAVMCTDGAFLFYNVVLGSMHIEGRRFLCSEQTLMSNFASTELSRCWQESEKAMSSAEALTYFQLS